MVRVRVIVMAALMVIAGAAVPAAAQPVDSGSAQFIGSLGDQALQVIRSDMAAPQKLAFFHQLLAQDFDMPAISRFVLGPYWRTASPVERRQFAELLSGDLVRFYSRRFAQYRGETFAVTGTRAGPAGTIVTSRIIRPDGPPIAVDWQLNVEDGLYKISDVIIDGVSMALAERAEIAQQIERGGGQVEALLASMRAQGEGAEPSGVCCAGPAFPPPLR
jgi:phospholipid transport system substrate-binding protein